MRRYFSAACPETRFARLEHPPADEAVETGRADLRDVPTAREPGGRSRGPLNPSMSNSKAA